MKQKHLMMMMMMKDDEILVEPDKHMLVSVNEPGDRVISILLTEKWSLKKYRFFRYKGFIHKLG